MAHPSKSSKAMGNNSMLAAPVWAGDKEWEQLTREHARTVQMRRREERTSICQTAVGYNIPGSMPSCVTGWPYCFSLACSQKMASVFCKGALWWHKAWLSWIKADCTARGEQSKDPETKMSAMHYHQPMVWEKLDVAKYGQHSKDSDLGASFGRGWERRYAFWSGAWPM